MTVIAGRIYPKKIIMACDLQTTWGDSKLVDAKNSMYIEPAKIWQHNGLTIGSSGYVSESVLFQVFTKTHKPDQATVDGIMNLLVEFTDWAKKKSADFKLQNHYLIIFEGKLFQAIQFSIHEVKEYNAVGSGMFLALGAMYKGATPQEAVEVAKQFDLFCGGETKTVEVKL